MPGDRRRDLKDADTNSTAGWGSWQDSTTLVARKFSMEPYVEIEKREDEMINMAQSCLGEMVEYIRTLEHKKKSKRQKRKQLKQEKARERLEFKRKQSRSTGKNKVDRW